MNWGKNVKGRLYLTFFGVSVCGLLNYGLARSFVSVGAKVLAQDYHLSENSYNQRGKIFEIKAEYDGVITIDCGEAFEYLKSVTVFTNDYKEIINQITDFDDGLITFQSDKGRSYQVMYFIIDAVKEVQWQTKHNEVKGINRNNPILIEGQSLSVNHADGLDKWFVYEAKSDEKVMISSVGQTSENTCLFVYDMQNESIVGSSNFVEGALQSEVILSAEEGKKYLIKWSSAFTNGSYSWSIKSL